ncbi:MAG: SBBP repeat-containing protein [Pyrinomonadaceae bacterium]
MSTQSLRACACAFRFFLLTFLLVALPAAARAAVHPEITFSSYFGGNGNDNNELGDGGIAVDAAGNVYVTGTVCPDNRCTAFVLKVDPEGTPVYVKYLGGGELTYGNAIAIDAEGNAYITGYTFGRVPSVNPAQRGPQGGLDAFVAKLDPTGSFFIYCTNLGGSGHDLGYGIAVDAEGRAYVTGKTRSANFPLAGSSPAMPGGSDDVFLTELSADGSAYLFSTLIGGSGDDTGYAVALDPAGGIYVAGSAISSNFPVTAGSLQTSYRSGDAFVAKFAAGGSSLIYSTFVGGSDFDIAFGLVVDAWGDAYLVGNTLSADFPTVNAFRRSFGSVGNVSQDAFVAKLNANGSALLFSTFLGGRENDGGNGIALDASGNVYVTGNTGSLDFPLVGTNVSSKTNRHPSAFAAEFDPSGRALYCTYFGGSEIDDGYGIAPDGHGGAWVTGATASTDFPVVNPFQPSLGNGGIPNPFDAYLTRLRTSSDVTPPTTTAALSSLPNASGWLNREVTVTLTASDEVGGSGVREITYSADGALSSAPMTAAGATASLTVTAEGETTITFYATDAAGNREAPHTLTVRIDTSSPSVSCDAPDGLWHAQDVTLSCAASDPLSGLADPASQSFGLVTGLAPGEESPSVQTNSREVCDAASNCVTAGPVGGNKIDKRPPVINITSPTAGIYLLNQLVLVHFNCTDGGSGVATCSGTSTTGSSLNTSSAGMKIFTVTAADMVGNAAAPSEVGYTISYGVRVLSDVSKAAKSGSTIPLKVRLVDASGANVSSPAVTLHAVGVVQIGSSAVPLLDDAGESNPDFDFRYDSSLGGYVFNLKTTGYSTGTFLLYYTVGADPTPHSVQFQVRR